MLHRLLLALALAAGVSSAAQAQAQVFTVASCSATGVSNAPGTIGRFYAGPDGVLCVSGGGGGGGGSANPYPGSDYATSARQDAQTAALGAPADAAYTGSGNAGNVALGKGQYAILSNLLASIGASGDTAATATGANGSQVALLKALRDKLNGTVAVTQSGTWTVAQGAAGANAWKVDGSGVTQPISGTVSVGNFPASQAVTNAGTFAVQNTAATPAGGNVIGFTTQRSAGTNRSATVTTTAANLMAANTGRQGWKIKNDCTVAVWINFDGTASAAAGSGNFQIAAGAYMASEPGFVETGAMSAMAASGSCALTVREH